MSERHTQPCPGTRICCPRCHTPVPYAEIPDGEGFFLCSRRRCGTHFYAACAAYYCTTTEVARAEREHMRTLGTQAERLAYLATRVAWPMDELRAEAA